MNTIPPDLQSALLCEDVRTEVSGQQTLVGVLGVIPAPAVPVGFFKLCLWTRWCGGVGEFLQRSLILGCDDDQPLAQTEVKFVLPELNSHATNVHMFGGLQFPKHGIYHVEIRLDREIRLRFPLPVIPLKPQG
jgi:hypothetical protein